MSRTMLYSQIYFFIFVLSLTNIAEKICQILHEKRNRLIRSFLFHLEWLHLPRFELMSITVIWKKIYLIRKIGSEIPVETRIDGEDRWPGITDETRSHVITWSDGGTIRPTILFTTSFSGLLTGKNFYLHFMRVDFTVRSPREIDFI